jgi:hypothetical protein
MAAMTTAVLDTPKTYEYDVEDIEYLRHGDKPLLARVFKPRGEGPFPALIECHGGAWCLSDRTTEKLRHQAMASHGIVSIALDFRLGEAQRQGAQDEARADRYFRPVERRASRDAGRHAAERSALRRDRAAGGIGSA